MLIKTTVIVYPKAWAFHICTRAYNSIHSTHSTSQIMTEMAIEDRFVALDHIGDGTFAKVVSARVRAAGSNLARRGTIVSKINFHCYYELQH